MNIIKHLLTFHHFSYFKLIWGRGTVEIELSHNTKYNLVEKKQTKYFMRFYILLSVSYPVNVSFTKCNSIAAKAQTENSSGLKCSLPLNLSEPHFPNL